MSFSTLIFFSSKRQLFHTCTKHSLLVPRKKSSRDPNFHPGLNSAGFVLHGCCGGVMHNIAASSCDASSASFLCTLSSMRLFSFAILVQERIISSKSISFACVAFLLKSLCKSVGYFFMKLLFFSVGSCSILFY